MNELKEKHLRPGRKITDQFIIASFLSILILVISGTLFPSKSPILGLFEKLLGGDHDAASATNGFFYNVNFGVEGSFGAVLILIGMCVLVYMKNRDKTEHTDLWVENDKQQQ